MLLGQEHLKEQLKQSAPDKAQHILLEKDTRSKRQQHNKEMVFWHYGLSGNDRWLLQKQ